jgi:hypothetical protein
MHYFTFRQQEFARYYASGLSAHKAAIQAGYSASTAESNSSRLLKHPAIQNAISQIRNERPKIDTNAITIAIARLTHIVSYSKDEKVAINAASQLRLVQLALSKLGITATANTQLLDTLLPIETPTITQPKLDKSINLQDSTEAQLIEYQLLNQNSSEPANSNESLTHNLAIPEQDHFPDGRLAADLRLRPSFAPAFLSPLSLQQAMNR